MATLHVELDVRDYDLWRDAFGRDAGGRQKAGVLRYCIFRPVDDDKHVMLDLDFDSAEKADGFLHDPEERRLVITREGASQARDAPGADPRERSRVSSTPSQP